MEISKQELASLRLKLANYKQEHGTIAVGQTESLNCPCANNCAVSCTIGCTTRCDGTGKGGGTCWTTRYGR